ncbi:MAG: hypothetical protein K2P54_01295, partial [Odoribacter sp.]|nr:hypothetical protein [Odoribacter sp.]
KVYRRERQLFIRDRGITLRQAALDSGMVTAEQFDAWVNPAEMTGRKEKGELS